MSTQTNIRGTDTCPAVSELANKRCRTKPPQPPDNAPKRSRRVFATRPHDRGPPDSPGEESFDITVCTPEWLADACRRTGGIYNPRHHLVVDFDEFDKRTLHDWLAARVRTIEADAWSEIGERLRRLGYWEFEDYKP